MAGNVTSIKDSTGSEVKYAYNAYSQLLKQQVLNGVTDPITTSYTYTNMDSIAETEGYRYAYDLNGNLTEKVSGTEITTYAYNAFNQLTEVVNPDGAWQSNTYDASGIRSMIAENGVTTEFMTFNGLVLSGYNKSGEQTEHYYYGNSLLAAEYANAEVELYYLKNSHGDVIGLTDSQGTLTEAYRYDAFGTLKNIKIINENGVLKDAETALSRFLYAGEQCDAVTGLYYLRARQYDTSIGRFTQEDTYLGDGRNLYVYVGNNPLKYVDPSGHEKTGGYNSSYYSQYLNELGAVPPEVLIIYNQTEAAKKEAGKDLIWSGAINTVKGAMETTAGTLVTLAGVAVTPVYPVIGFSGATVGAGYANMGLSNMWEGVQDIYNGIIGKVDVQAFNPTRDTFFGGNQTAYNQAEAIFGGANLIFGIGLSYLPTSVPSSGSITEYANAGSQMLDLVDVLEESSEGGSDVINKLDDVLSSKTLTNQTKKVDNYVSSIKGNAAAKADFDAMNPTNIRTYANGTIAGDLPDGRTINIHPSTTLGGTPSVEIYDPVTGKSIKIRY